MSPRRLSHWVARWAVKMAPTLLSLSCEHALSQLDHSAALDVRSRHEASIANGRGGIDRCHWASP